MTYFCLISQWYNKRELYRRCRLFYRYLAYAVRAPIYIWFCIYFLSALPSPRHSDPPSIVRLACWLHLLLLTCALSHTSWRTMRFQALKNRAELPGRLGGRNGGGKVIHGVGWGESKRKSRGLERSVEMAMQFVPCSLVSFGCSCLHSSPYLMGLH